jgi:hypothetical protein
MQANLLTVLQQTLAFIKSSEKLSSYADKDRLERELNSVIISVKTKSASKQTLTYLYAPTGPIQELAISNNWSEEFLDLASAVDNLVANSE